MTYESRVSRGSQGPKQGLPCVRPPPPSLPKPFWLSFPQCLFQSPLLPEVILVPSVTSSPPTPLPFVLPCPAPPTTCVYLSHGRLLPEDRPQGGGEPSVFTLHSAPRQCLAYNGCSEITERQKRLIAFTPQPSTLEVRIRG